MDNILSRTNSFNSVDDEEEGLFIDEEISEYESFYILDETDQEWIPVINLGRQPSSLLQSLLESSKGALPAVGSSWTTVKTSVRSKLESLQGTWVQQRRPQSQVLFTRLADAFSSWSPPSFRDAAVKFPISNPLETPRWFGSPQSARQRPRSPSRGKLELAPLSFPVQEDPKGIRASFGSGPGRASDEPEWTRRSPVE